tara:strand:- start:1762 stop:2172 length:411 start_codon:yes stop_codon:yes gene_type:complete
MENLIPSYISLDINITSKTDVIKFLVDQLYDLGKIKNKEYYLKAVLDRENLLSTYCGYGVAIPHAECDEVIEPSFAFGRSSGLIWDEGDELAQFIILLAIPIGRVGEDNNHIEMMSEVAEISLRGRHKSKMVICNL